MKGKITMTICVGCTALILTMIMFTQFKTVDETDITVLVNGTPTTDGITVQVEEDVSVTVENGKQYKIIVTGFPQTVYGLTVVIDHGDGYQTIYANLLTSEFVVEGENVEKGQSIGTVGNTAPFEILDEPHLHFEILKDNESVDPNMYLKN